MKGVQLKAIEREGDQITRQIFEALNTTFITPFDREDIRSLASDLDDILDHLESVAKYLVLFELGEAPEPLRRFAEILLSMTEEIDRIRVLIWDMGEHQPKIQEAMVRISELENQGDSLYFTVISDLFKKGCTESIEILKWKEVYEGLEEACDRCKDFTHVVGQRRDQERLRRGACRPNGRPRPDHRRRARVRLPERLPRRRELDRHRRLDPRPLAAEGGASGRRSSTSSPPSCSAPTSRRPSAGA